ncbi:MAG TPA: TRAP transporter small permease [Rectinemataceae bacterium]|nr:TRAP transporter small permease [Rectinemataceae bacterium]
MKITAKSVGKFLLDTIELYIPALAFSTLFVSFMTQIVNRYFFKPLTWPEELSLLCFVWVALLGGLYAKRSESHVSFSLVYDLFKPKGQARIRIVGNALLALSFVIALKPCWDYVFAMSYRKSDVLHIPMQWAYFPFIVFLVDMIVRLAIDIWRDVSGLRKGSIA